MIALGLEEFAAKRRSEQSEVEAFLRPYVTRALDGKINTQGYAELITAVRAAWNAAYAKTTDTKKRQVPAPFIRDIKATLTKTDRPGADKTTADIIATWLATSVLSHSTVQAAKDHGDFVLEWVDMNDAKVRHTHHEANGQTVEPNESFKVGGHEMPYPGYSVGIPFDLWINCRCSVRAKLAEQEALVAGGFGSPSEIKRELEKAKAEGQWFLATFLEEMLVQTENEGVPPDSGQPEPTAETPAVDDPGYEGVTHAGLAVQAADTGRVLLMQRSLDPTDAPDVQGTWEFPGGGLEDGESPEEGARREFSEETGMEVPEGTITGGWRSANGVYQGFVLTVDIEREACDLNPEQAATANPDDPERARPEVCAWYSIEQIKALGANLRPEVHDTDWSQFSVGGGDHDYSEPDPAEEDTMPEDKSLAQITAEEFEAMVAAGATAVPWHGVLTIEGKASGDGRGFRKGAMRTRPMPLPLSWQKVSTEGHGQAVTVARIDRQVRVPVSDEVNEIRSHGVMLMTPEADEVVGLIGEFGRFGVSVDADDATVEGDSEGAMWFSDARSAGSCIVGIPAFHEAWVTLGEMPEDFYDGGTDLELIHGEEEPEEALVASAGVAMEDLLIPFADLAPGVTEDGPGWLTNYEDTDRLRDWWASQESGVGWGEEGDFNRCRALAAQYVKPQYVSGFCANRHKDALGVWPGQEMNAADTLGLQSAPAEVLNLVASAVRFETKAPHEWFEVEETDGPCPLTITPEGQVYGHIAQWGVCHLNVGAYGDCFLAPKSPSNYSHFLLGGVLTDRDEEVAVGALSIGGGHAGPKLGVRPALEHYDSTSTAFAHVNAWDGKHGIWVCGWVPPGTPESMVIAARASKLSGDWRRTAHGLDLVAALSVNVPGYEVPRLVASMEGDEVVSLVAAGVVAEPPAVEASEVDIDALAFAVALRLDEFEQNRKALAALEGKFTSEKEHV